MRYIYLKIHTTCILYIYTPIHTYNTHIHHGNTNTSLHQD